MVLNAQSTKGTDAQFLINYIHPYSKAVYSSKNYNMKNKISFLLLSICFHIISIPTFGQCDPCQPLGTNLIQNGEFLVNGPTINTELTLDCGCTNNSYCLNTSAQVIDCPNTTIPPIMSLDNSQFMLIQTMDAPIDIWKSDFPIPVEPFKQYNFSFQVHPNLSGNPNVNGFDILINGQPVFNWFPQPDQWTDVCFMWDSGTNQTVDLTIRQEQPSGSQTNFIGLDHVTLNKVLPEPINCQFMVQYDETLSAAEIQQIRDSYMGINITSICPCGNIDLWDITNFPVTTSDGKTLIDIEDIRKDSRDKADVQSSDYNYNNETPQSLGGSGNMASLPQPTPETDNCAIVVAVIDTGVDKCHPHLDENMWSNCNPCPTYANEGYNFPMDNIDFYDDSYNGHGTHVAGIVKSYYDAYNLDQTVGVEIMPLKAFDGVTGQGTLYDIVCAAEFAIENGADVINMSFGYRGDSTEILYRTIERAKTVNEIIVVASVGNDTMDNDISEHYPSNHGNSNLIAVAADSADYELSYFSSWGANHVDISTDGWIESSIPFATDTEDGAQDGYTYLNGTSMAAPQISAAAAMTKQYLVDASAIKNIILTSGVPLAVTSKPTVTNKSFDFQLLQSTLSTYNPCPTCCSALASCAVPCPSCEITGDFCYESEASSVSFTNNTYGNGTVSYIWDFGDGTSSIDMNPTKTYSFTGSQTFTVCLTISNILADQTECCKTICKDITLTKPCYDNIPGPEFNFNSFSNGSVKFNNPSGAGDAFTKTWTIDGTFYSNLNQPPVANSLSPGFHDVCLEVSKNSNPNCSETYCRKVYINDPCSVPTIARFKHLGCVNSGSVIFESTSTGVDSNTIYEWDFGDGSNGSGSPISHMYDSLGTYLVCLNIKNDQCSKRMCYSIEIQSSSIDENCPMPREAFPPILNDPWNSGQDLQVIPNPAKNKITAVFSQIREESATLSLTNLKGQEIQRHSLQKGFNNFDMILDELPPGMYILSLHHQDGKVISAKLMKE